MQSLTAVFPHSAASAGFPFDSKQVFQHAGNSGVPDGTGAELTGEAGEELGAAYDDGAGTLLLSTGETSVELVGGAA